MTRLCLLFTAVVLAGCGTDPEGAPLPASSAPVERAGVTVTADPPVQPPKILLVSAAGKQVAMQGSYCVVAVRSSGASKGRCVDGAWPHPERVTVVEPGDGVSVILSDAQVRREGTVTVLPFGCEHEVIKTIDLNRGAQSTAFTVDLEPGAYELEVFARFKSDDGRTGDVSGALGLVVASDAPPAIEPGPPPRSNC